MFHALRTDWRPALKDRSWHEMRAQVVEFCASGASSGLVAKADAIYDAQRLDAELRAAGVGPDCAEIILLDRDPWDRFLSFVGHERKLGKRRIEALRDAFDTEETAAAEGRKALLSSGWKVTDIRYEDFKDNPPDALFGLPLSRVAEQLNSRGEVLPFFGLIRRLVESSLYGKIRETRALVALKGFYYKNVAHRSDTKNGFVHVVVLGSVAGPLDGQRRITGMFARRSSFRISLIDFVNHRRWWGPLRIISQVLQGLLLVLFRRVDVVYLAISRTNFGLIRDFLLLSPLMLSNPRVIAHVHGAEFDDYYFKTSRFRGLKSKQLGRVDQLLFIHEQLRSQAPDIASKSNVLRNPVPDFARAARRVKRLEAAQRPIFGFISAFVPGKGIEDFLELAEGRAAQAQFCIAGGTHPKFLAYGAEIEDQIKSRAEIEYLGYLGDPSGFYQKVDFVVFPTSYVSEALPGVILEALSFGCVPIVKRCNLLPTVFADAPIRWFEDRESLLTSVDSVLAQPLECTAELKTAGQCWVRAEFPSETDWLERLERNLLGWETSTEDF